MADEIIPGWEIVDLSLYSQKRKLLAIADLHLGYEGMMNKEGVLLPRFNFKEIQKRLRERVFSVLKKGGKGIEFILINGDLKHEFGTISEQEWNEVIDLLRFLQKYCKKIILVKGNHDSILGPIAKWEGIEILDEFFLGEGKLLFLHGNKTEPGKIDSAKTIVIAHEHPAVSISEGAKHELFKCFLRGKWKGKTLVVMPSLNAISIGADITREKRLSPFLKQDLQEFEVWVVEDRPYFFGKLKELA
ncbi:MAG: metallophosphoesterase [Candidatus Diapherotrites archaeon]